MNGAGRLLAFREINGGPRCIKVCGSAETRSLATADRKRTSNKIFESFIDLCLGESAKTDEHSLREMSGIQIWIATETGLEHFIKIMILVEKRSDHDVLRFLY